MADKNTISVVMCTCNGKSRHLAEQIESIFAQTLCPMEIVVQDDCSTDGTLELLEAYAKKAPKEWRSAYTVTTRGWVLTEISSAP